MDKATKCMRRFALDWLLVMGFVLACVLLSLIVGGAPAVFFALLWKVFLFCYAVGRFWWAIGVLRAEPEEPEPAPPEPRRPWIMQWLVSFCVAVVIVCVIVSYSGHIKRKPVRLAQSGGDALEKVFAEAEEQSAADKEDSSGESGDGEQQELFIVNTVN